jgi:hypothetical protein
MGASRPQCEMDTMMHRPETGRLVLLCSVAAMAPTHAWQRSFQI